MPRFRIQGLDKKTLGIVYGQTKGAALQAAVDQGLVSGRRKILAASPLQSNEPYEQSFSDIYGACQKPVYRSPAKA